MSFSISACKGSGLKTETEIVIECRVRRVFTSRNFLFSFSVKEFAFSLKLFSFVVRLFSSISFWITEPMRTQSLAFGKTCQVLKGGRRQVFCCVVEVLITKAGGKNLWENDNLCSFRYGFESQVESFFKIFLFSAVKYIHLDTDNFHILSTNFRFEFDQCKAFRI